MFSSELIGLLSAVFAAVNSYLIFMSVRLLRFELFLIAVLLFFYVLFLKTDKSNFRCILIGISGGIVCLTRITSLSFVIPFIVFIFWRDKIALKKMIVPLSILIIMVLMVTLIDRFSAYIRKKIIKVESLE